MVNPELQIMKYGGPSISKGIGFHVLPKSMDMQVMMDIQRVNCKWSQEKEIG